MCSGTGCLISKYGRGAIPPPAPSGGGVGGVGAGQTGFKFRLPGPNLFIATCTSDWGRLHESSRLPDAAGEEEYIGLEQALDVAIDSFYTDLL
jgi:hypothetical protein